MIDKASSIDVHLEYPSVLQRVRGSATVGLCFLNSAPAIARTGSVESETIQHNEVRGIDPLGEELNRTSSLSPSTKPGFDVVNHADIAEPLIQQPLPNGWEGEHVTLGSLITDIVVVLFR